MRQIRNRYLRALLLASLYLFGFVGIVASGGSGNGDDDDSNQVVVPADVSISRSVWINTITPQRFNTASDSFK